MGARLFFVFERCAYPDLKPTMDTSEAYQFIIENTPDVITRWDKELKLIFANKALEAKTGVANSMLYGKTKLDMGQPDEVALHWMDILRSVFEKGTGESHYNSLHTATGIVHFYSRLIPEKNAAGEVETVFAIGRDISELRSVIQNNDEQKTFLLKLSDALRPLHDPIEMQAIASRFLGEHLNADWACYVEFDDELSVATVHQNYARHTGPSLVGDHPAADIPGLIEAMKKGATYLIHDLDTDTLNPDAHHKCRTMGIKATAAIPLMKKDRAVASIVVSSREQRQWNGHEISLMEETARRTWDAVERARVEQALIRSREDYRLHLEQEVNERTVELQESKELLQSIYDTSLIQMSVLKAVRDETGKITDFMITIVNRELERETGRKDLVGKLYAQEYPGIKASGLFDTICRVVESGHPEQLEYFYPFENFNKWFSCMFVKMDDGVVATNLDITARKEAEEERFRNMVLLEQTEELAKMGSWQFDLHTGRLIWSDGMYRLFNLYRSVPVEPAIYLRYATEKSRAIAERIVTLIQSGAQAFEETLEILVDEQVKVLKLKSVIIYGADEKPARTLGVDMDITALVEADKRNRYLQEQQKQREEQKQKELMDIRLYQQREILNAIMMTQEQERERIGESVHNGVAQLLYGVQTRLQLLKVNTPDDEKQLKTILNIVSDAINDTRRIAFELVPAVLKDYGIEVALNELIRKIVKGNPVVSLELSGITELPEKLEFAIYRIVQELLNNIIKHSGATEASVIIKQHLNSISMIVTDNGVGFQELLPRRVGNGMGLKNVRNRVKLLEGRFTLNSSPGEGSRITITLPIH